MWHNYNYSYFYYEFHWWTACFSLVFWGWYCLIYFIICLGILMMILCDTVSFVHWTVVNTDTWFNVLYTRRQQYSSTQWSKCCGLTNHSQVSLQQISNHCDRVQHYCQLWYKKKRFWCCSLLCSLGTHLVTITSGQWQLHMYKKMFR